MNKMAAKAVNFVLLEEVFMRIALLLRGTDGFVDETEESKNG